MADIANPPIQPGPGEPTVSAPSILNGARLNPNISLTTGSAVCVRECECPQGRAIDHCAAPDPAPFTPLAEAFKYEFRPFAWRAFDSDELDENCAVDDDTLALLDEIVASGAPYMLGQELDSAPLTGGPSLQSEATPAPDVTGPVHPVDAIAQLLRITSKNGQTRNTFIAADHILPALVESGVATQVNGQWRILGRPAIFSPGISGDGPDGRAAAADTSWIYIVKGSVDYNWAPVNWADIGLSGELTEEQMNLIYFQAEAHGVVRFNPECAFAIEICIRHESCCGA